MFVESTTAVPGLPPAHAEVSCGADYPERRTQAWLLAKAAAPSIQALILSDPLDIRYLTGVHEGIFWLVLGEDALALAVTRHMLVNEVSSEATGCEVLLPGAAYPPPTNNDSFIAAELVRRHLLSAAFLPAKTSHLAHSALTASQVELHAVPDVVATLRTIKDPWEIDLIRHCTAIAEKALNEMVRAGASAWIGRSEHAIATELEARMRAIGADRQGFPETGIIVASGPNSASCHHRPGRRTVRRGDTILIDWGAEVDGYRSDLTRTFFIGSVPDFALTAYPVVEEAHDRAAARLHADATTSDADCAARDAVRDAGFEEFYYGVGHGVGLAVHEAPWLRPGGTELLLPNMVTTIEPGVYLPGIGGIRIEDIYLITPDGPERIGSLAYGLKDAVIT